MTEEELEQKAEEYIRKIGYHSAVSYLEQLEKVYKDGYKEGQEDCRFSELKNGNPFFVASELEKENAELKDFLYENESREKELCILCENLKAQIEKLLKELKDKGIVKSWYYNGQFKWELAE